MDNHVIYNGIKYQSLTCSYNPRYHLLLDPCRVEYFNYCLWDGAGTKNIFLLKARARLLLMVIGQCHGCLLAPLGYLMPSCGISKSTLPYLVIVILFLEGGEVLPVSTTARIVVSSLWFVIIVIICTYNSNLMSFLTVTIKELPYQTLEEALQYGNTEFYVGRTSVGKSFFEVSNFGFAEYESVLACPSVCISGTTTKIPILVLPSSLIWRLDISW